jgi:HK97 family phage portal protein
MSFLSSLFRAPAEKRSRTAALVAISGPGRAHWSSPEPKRFHAEALARNPVAARAVTRIAQAVAEIPIQFTADGADASAYPAALLIERPNERQDRLALTETLAAHLLLTGNAYVEAVALDGRVRELHALRPDRMRLVAGADGRTAAFDYEVDGRSVRFTQGEGEGVPPILHLTLPHPFDDHFGLAPLQAAASAIDIHNAATQWTKALLDNAARPSGALVYSGGDGTLSEDQYERLKRELEEGFSGSRNAGRPLLLEGGLDWKALSLTPRDMDFMEAKHGAAREIALAFGVPPIVLGIPGDATYANYQEANRAFCRDTALPLARRIAGGLAGWLAGDAGLVATPDEDAIGALHAERESLWRRVERASFLTEGEKREAVGYPGERPAI